MAGSELGNLRGSQPLGALLAGTPIPAPGRERGWKHCPTAPSDGPECSSQHWFPTNKRSILFSRPGGYKSCTSVNPTDSPSSLGGAKLSPITAPLPGLYLPLGAPFPPWSALSRKPPDTTPAPSAFRITPGTTQVVTTSSCVCLPHRALSPMRAATVSALVNTVSPKPETIPVYNRCSIYTVR